MDSKETMKKLAEMWEPHNPGEWQLKQHFRTNGAEVEDVSDNPTYWKLDIDMLVNDNGNKFSVEVKWDGVISRTGNLFIEEISDIDKNKAGWFKICKADFLYYGDSKNKLYYIFEVPQLRKFVEENKQNLKQRNAADFRRGELIKRSMGYIIPLKEVQHLYKVLKLEEQA